MIVLDSGAVTFFAGQSGRSDELLSQLRKHGKLFVPSVVLVECLTGTAADARANRFLKTCTVLETFPLVLSRLAAHFRSSAGRGSAVDAIVVAHAMRGTVVTGDADDITALAAHAPGVTVITI